jgi:transglutaminase-like putative cysteine protease
VLKVSTVELAAAGDGTAGPDPGERYRALPPVPARVAELARSLTADAPTTLAKVQAVERWLGANVTYTLDIPPLPAGADAVDRFLFEDRRGYCQQVASAFAVLLRVAGVPTRIATGVVAGDRDDLTGEWAVRARDAHAWVEVWFDGIGWQGIDPTASVPLGG